MLELPNPEDKYRVIRILTQPLHDVNYGFFERFRENKIFVRFTFANLFLVSDTDLGSYLVEGFIQSYQKYLIPRIYIDDNITLLRAIAFGNVDELKKLIKKGNDVNERNFLGETPLLACAAYATCQIAKILLEANANILAVDSNNNSPIYLASERNNFDLVALLADARADLNAITNNKSPLSEALRRKDINMVKLLLEKGARTDISAERFSPSLNYALSVCPQAVPLLLEHKADPNSKEKKDGSASLCFALTHDNFDAIRLLCAHKADPNQQDNNGITPLIWAMAYGKLEALKILLANGGDCFSKGPEGVSLYDCAKKLNLTDIIALFDE
jgi:ankyrin repeat protein